jgi:hypothetical protein
MRRVAPPQAAIDDFTIRCLWWALAASSGANAYTTGQWGMVVICFVAAWFGYRRKRLNPGPIYE